MTDHSLPEDTEGMPDPCAHHTHEHVGWRKWAPLIGYIILSIGIMIALTTAYNTNRKYATQNRELIERVASDCFDRDGDLSYRHVLRGLIRLNHNQDPKTGKLLPPSLPVRQRQAKTAKVLEDGLAEAGITPPCIENP